MFTSQVRGTGGLLKPRPCRQPARRSTAPCVPTGSIWRPITVIIGPGDLSLRRVQCPPLLTSWPTSECTSILRILPNQNVAVTGAVSNCSMHQENGSACTPRPGSSATRSRSISTPMLVLDGCARRPHRSLNRHRAADPHLRPAGAGGGTRSACCERVAGQVSGTVSTASDIAAGVGRATRSSRLDLVGSRVVISRRRRETAAPNYPAWPIGAARSPAWSGSRRRIDPGDGDRWSALGGCCPEFRLAAAVHGGRRRLRTSRRRHRRILLGQPRRVQNEFGELGDGSTTDPDCRRRVGPTRRSRRSGQCRRRRLRRHPPRTWVRDPLPRVGLTCSPRSLPATPTLALLSDTTVKCWRKCLP